MEVGFASKRKLGLARTFPAIARVCVNFIIKAGALDGTLSGRIVDLLLEDYATDQA